MDHSLVNMASTIDNESNEEIKLPADTLAILNEFLREKQERETTFQLSDCIAFDTLQEDWVSVAKQLEFPKSVWLKMIYFYFYFLFHHVHAANESILVRRNNKTESNKNLP